MHDLMPLPAVQKSVAFLYTKDEISERECEKKYLLKSHQKREKKQLRNKPDQRDEMPKTIKH